MLSENVKSMESRYDIIMQWYKMGGVLLLGYEMYRLLALSVPSIGGKLTVCLYNYVHIHYIITFRVHVHA